MSDLTDAMPAESAKVDPATLTLRGRRRPVVRFRRGLIVAITGATAISLTALSWLALQPPSFHKGPAPIEAGEEESPAVRPEALDNVPRTYGDVPKLGPPLPGDLGRAILDQERSQQKAIPSSPAGTGARPDGGESAAAVARERAQSALSAARASGLMVQLGSGVPQPLLDAPTDGRDVPHAAASEPLAAVVPAAQQHKIGFVQSGEGGFSQARLVTAASPWTLSAGTIIPAALVTGLNSDLPGLVLAQVTENVRDSATGRIILVPQGARLIGKYDSVVALGQRRALLVWTRVILPDGSSIDLDHVPATDVSGYSGLADGVGSHSWQLLKGIAMSTLLGVSAQLSLGGGGDLLRALRESAQENVSRAGDQITSRNLDIQPTITVRPGWPVRAILNKDLVLEPWGG